MLRGSPHWGRPGGHLPQTQAQALSTQDLSSSLVSVTRHLWVSVKSSSTLRFPQLTLLLSVLPGWEGSVTSAAECSARGLAHRACLINEKRAPRFRRRGVWSLVWPMQGLGGGSRDVGVPGLGPGARSWSCSEAVGTVPWLLSGAGGLGALAAAAMGETGAGRSGTCRERRMCFSGLGGPGWQGVRRRESPAWGRPSELDLALGVTVPSQGSP